MLCKSRELEQGIFHPRIAKQEGPKWDLAGAGAGVSSLQAYRCFLRLYDFTAHAADALPGLQGVIRGKPVRAVLEPIGNIPPATAEEHYYATLDQPAMTA